MAEIKLNGKRYRIDPGTYRDHDMVDLMPRGSVPGNAIVMSDLGLYQPMIISDWRHGFGHQYHDDAAGYLATSGCVDTRQDGMVMLYTNPVASEAIDNVRKGGLVFNDAYYTYGPNGIRKYQNAAWSEVRTIAPSLDTYATNSGNSVSSVAVNLTISEKEQNRILLVMISSNALPTSVIYDGITLTRGTYASGTGAYASIYYAINPPTGAGTVTANFPSSTVAIVTAVVYSNIDQSDPFGAADGWTMPTGNASSTSSSISCTTDLNAIVVDVLAKVNDDTLLVGSGQTLLANTAVSTTLENGVSWEVGAGSVAMSWSWGSTSRQYAHTALALKPSFDPSVLSLLDLGDYLFANIENGRLRRSTKDRVIDIQPNEAESTDTYLSQAAPNTAYGKNKVLRIGKASGSEFVSLLKFDLSSIPAGATIKKVTLNLWIKEMSGAAFQLNVNRLNKGFSEEATWNKFDGITAWTTGGASGAASDYIATSSLYVGTPTGMAKGATISMQLDLTDFALLRASNRGIRVSCTTGLTTNNIQVASSSNVESGRRPFLRIEYNMTDEWVSAGADSNSGDYSWMLVHNGLVYAGKRLKPRIHTASDISLATLQGGDTDTTAVQVGLGYASNNAIVYAGNLYVTRPDGIWMVGEDKIARRVLDYSDQASEDNFKSICIHNGLLTFAIRDRIYQWNGARTTDITPPKISDTFPFITYGSFSNFVTVGSYMYCTARTNESTYKERLLCWDGIAWYSLVDLIVDGLGTCNFVGYDVLNNYLWYQIDGTTMYYIPMQENSDFPYPAFPTTGIHSLYTSRMDMGFRKIWKYMPTIEVQAQNCNINRKIDVYISLDGGEYTLIGTVTSNGITTITPEVRQTFKYAILRFDFITNNAAQSPVLEEIVVRFLLRPETYWGWSMGIICATNYEEGMHQDERSSREIKDELLSIRQSVTPVEFVDIDGSTYDVYISAITGQLLEDHVDEGEQDLVRNLEKLLMINLVEA